MVPKRLQTQETIRRYQKIDGVISKVLSKKPQFKELLTEKLDKVLVHPFWGYVIFATILLIIFQSVFFLAEYPMNWISDFFLGLSSLANEHLPEGLNQLLNCKRNYSWNRWYCGFRTTNRDSFIFPLSPRRFRIYGASYFLDELLFATVWVEQEKYCSSRFGNSMRNSCNHVHKKY